MDLGTGATSVRDWGPSAIGQRLAGQRLVSDQRLAAIGVRVDLVTKPRGAQPIARYAGFPAVAGFLASELNIFIGSVGLGTKGYRG
jgi:hypothetical protein